MLQGRVPTKPHNTQRNAVGRRKRRHSVNTSAARRHEKSKQRSQQTSLEHIMQGLDVSVCSLLSC
jgi:hypothetical protein